MTNAIRDENHVPVALGVSNSDATVTLPFKMEVATGRLLTAGAGAGVSGPVSSTDNAVARWNGTTGAAIQNSGVLIDDSGHMSLGGSTDFTAPLSIKGPSDYGHIELQNTASTKIGGWGISDTTDQIVIGSVAGNMVLWNNQAIDFSADSGTTNAVSVTATNDIEVNTAAKGIILHSDNNTKFRVHVSNAGALVITAI